MRHWARELVEKVLSPTIQLQPSDIADVERILKYVEDGEYYLFRSEELAGLCEEMDYAQSLSEVSEILSSAAVASGFAHFSLYVLRQGSAGPFKTRVCTSLPKSWIHLYISKDYRFIDPIASMALESEEWFEFNDVPDGSPVLKSFWADARDHGVGNYGICFPVALPDGGKLAIQFSGNGTEEAVSEALSQSRCDLRQISVSAASVFESLARSSFSSSAAVSLEELRFLYELSKGEGESISPAGIQDSIKRKLGVRTMTQAVSVAISNKWFDDLPYVEGEIISHATLVCA